LLGVSPERPAAAAHGGDLEGYESYEWHVVGSHKFLDIEGERIETVGIQDIAIILEIEGEICGEGSAWWFGGVR